MISQKLLAELNDQIKHELFSAHYYLSMAAFCADQNFSGFSNFFLVQSSEEKEHALKFFNFILDLGEKPEIYGLEQPKNEFSSLEEILHLGLEHEKFVTQRIHEILELALEEKHHPTVSFLQWFVDEQVEEEASMEKILEEIRLVGEKGTGLFLLDRELSRRKS